MQRIIHFWSGYFKFLCRVWFGIAGAGLIIVLAFLSDSSPDALAFLGLALEVGAKILLVPLFFIGIASLIISTCHYLIECAFISREDSTYLPPLDEERSSTESPINVDDSSTRVPQKRFPFIPVTFGTLLVSVGVTTILTKAPQTFRTKGLAPTIITCSVFLVLLVLVPTVIIARLLINYWRRK